MTHPPALPDARFAENSARRASLGRPLYREVLKQAWHLTWRHKILWAFGLFSAVLGTGGALEILVRHFNAVFNLQGPGSWLGYCRWPTHWRFDLISGLWSVALGLLLLGLAVFLAFVVVNSFGTLILAADKFRTNKRADLFKFWHKAREKFWLVLGLVVFFKLVMFVFSALSLAPLWLVAVDQASAWLLLFYPFIFLASVLIVLISSFLLIYAAAFVLTEGYGWREAIIASWLIFYRHWLVNAEMAIIIFLINLSVGLLAVLAAGALGLPVFLIFLTSIAIQLPPLGTVAVAAGLLLAAVLILWAASLLAVFQISAWVLLWRRMHKGTAVSKLVRIIGRIFKK